MLVKVTANFLKFISKISICKAALMRIFSAKYLKMHPLIICLFADHSEFSKIWLKLFLKIYFRNFPLNLRRKLLHNFAFKLKTISLHKFKTRLKTNWHAN